MYPFTRSERQRKLTWTHTKRIVVLGDGDTGKTSLIMRYATKLYPGAIVPHTIEDETVNMALFGKLFSLDICDSDIYFAASLDGYVGASAFIFCFGIDHPPSLKEVIDIWELDKKDREEAILLVGCKVDTRVNRDNAGAYHEEKFVSFEKGMEMARHIGASIYLECSAKTGENIEEVFHHAVRLSLRAKAVV